MDETTAVATETAAPIETEASSSSAEVETGATAADPALDDAGTETPAEGDETAAEPTDGEETESPRETQGKQDELAEFQLSVAAKLREMGKQAPGLTELLNKFPKVRDSIAASIKRDLGYRDAFATVAEAQAMREAFPGGIEDVNHVMQELDELGNIDGAFYGRKPEQLIAHMEKADRDGAIALLSEAPRHLARLDPERYSEIIGGAIAATLQRDRAQSLDLVLRIYNRAKAAGDGETQSEAADAYNYLNAFGRKSAEDSPEARRLRDDRQKFAREQETERSKNAREFHNTFLGESTKFQRELVTANPLFKKLPQAIPQAKRDRMADMIRDRIIDYLGKVRGFKRAIQSAHDARDMKQCLAVQKNGWRPWLVNKFTKEVLAEETPGIIQGNNAAVAQKRAAAGNTRIATRSPERTQTPADRQDKRTEPSQFSQEEIMNGKADAVIAAWKKRNGYA